MLQLDPPIYTKAWRRSRITTTARRVPTRAVGSGGSGERTRFLERSPRTLKAAEGHMLLQTSSPLQHHCSSGPINGLPPGVLQPETYPSSERPVKHPSRSPRQYTFWNCLHPRWYWGPGNCCKPANASSHRPRRLREVLQLTPTSLSLEPLTPRLDTDTAEHPNHAPSTGTLASIARFTNAPYPSTIHHVAPPWYTYQHQPPQFSFMPAGDSTPIPVRGMPQTQRPSTHAAPPPTRSPKQCFSAVASGRRSQPLSHPREILRDSFRSRSTYSRRPPTAAAFQPHPTLLRRPSVQSSTPPGSCPKTIPKTLHR